MSKYTFSTKRWNRLQTVFKRAVELQGDEQRSYLDKTCIDEPELKAQIESMLLLCDEKTVFGDVVANVATSILDKETTRLGQQIGPYRLLEELGTGGMGAVYLAERADKTYRKKVALKVIRAGLGTLEIQRRFRSERQMLANLEHPYIARLLDGGTTVDGLPFLVMEYVDGLPLDQYCDEHELTIAQRLDLFRKVCKAVQFAHQNLIVHRDLKPTNILVDKEGVPKLLDFGIAKLLDTGNANVTVAMTRTGDRILTPWFASPEQLRGTPVGTISDIYSLGMILYVLLTGNRPYIVQSTALGSLEKAILESEPMLPSTAIHHATKSDTEQSQYPSSRIVAQLRKLNPEKLRRILKGDLDNIILMALRKEPTRRYQSVEQLDEDIRCYLNDLPVIARADNWHYRTRKFLLRNRLASAVFTLVLILVISFAFTAAYQAKQVGQERDKAQAVSGFLTDMLAAVNPEKAQGRDILVKDLLEDAAKTLQDPDNTIAQQPLVKAELQATLGQTYLSLGSYKQAELLFEQVYQVRSAELGDSHPETLDAMQALANVYNQQSRFKKASQIWKQLVQIRQASLGPTHPLVLQALHGQALMLDINSEFTEAERLYKQVLAGWSKNTNDVPLDAYRTMLNLAGIYSELGRFSEAEPLLNRVIQGRTKYLGSDHPRTINAQKAMADTLRLQNRTAEAETLYHEIIDRQRRVLGDEHPDVLATMTNLAIVYWQQGNFGKNRKTLRQALQLSRKILGSDHEDTLFIMNNLALAYLEQGQLQQAQQLGHEVWERRRLLYGEDNTLTLRTQQLMGQLARKQGRYEEAIALLSDVMQKFKSNIDPDHRYVLEVENNLVEVYIDAGRLTDARALGYASLERHRSGLGETHLDTLDLLLLLASLELKQGSYQTGEKHALQSLKGFQTQLGDTHPSTQQCFKTLVQIYNAWGKPDRAASYAALIHESAVQDTH